MSIYFEIYLALKLDKYERIVCSLIHEYENVEKIFQWKMGIGFPTFKILFFSLSYDFSYIVIYTNVVLKVNVYVASKVFDRKKTFVGVYCPLK